MKENEMATQDTSDLIKEIIRLKSAIRKHRDEKGDDRCWMSDYELYLVLNEPIPEYSCQLDDPETMIKNCQRFIQSRHDPSKSYISPQEEIWKLKVEVAYLRRIIETM